MTTVKMTLKHGAQGKTDVELELTEHVLTLWEPDREGEYGDQSVGLDRWQIMKLHQVLTLWVDQEQL